MTRPYKDEVCEQVSIRFAWNALAMLPTQYETVLTRGARCGVFDRIRIALRVPVKAEIRR